MTTGSNDIEVLRRKIETYFSQKQLGYEVKPNGEYWIRQGSTVVVIRPIPWNERTLVQIGAPVALEVTKITPELTRFLLEKNSELVFGRFSLSKDGKTIWYEHVLLGDFLDAEELFTGVVAVAITADQNDEQISEMAGGKRAADM